MAEAKRDRSIVSLAWLAHWAFLGDEDPQFIGEYVDEALEVVTRIGSADRPPTGKEIADLTIFLCGLRAALDSKGGTPLTLTAEHRKTSEQGGRRRLSYDEKLRRGQAGARAHNYRQRDNLPKAVAIERAWSDMRASGRADGLSERIIEREMAAYRRALEELKTRQ